MKRKFNVYIIQIDGPLPNLALMKIAKWHQLLGDTVTLKPAGEPDIIYASVVFHQNRWKAAGLKAMFPKSNVVIGGPGWSATSRLPDQVEHIMPAYDLWGVDFSMGFTTRGCLRNCEWCVVPATEGKIRVHAPITEFWDERHDKLILMDHNFTAAPNWEDTLDFIIERQLKCNLNNGLDLRLVTKPMAVKLAEIKWYSWKFSRQTLYGAFDHPNYENGVRRGIQNLQDAGIDTQHKLMVYVLVGFNTTIEEDLKRVEILRELKCLPYVMVYNKRKDTIYKYLQRYVNRKAFFYTQTFDEYLMEALKRPTNPKDYATPPPPVKPAYLLRTENLKETITL